MSFTPWKFISWKKVYGVHVLTLEKLFNIFKPHLSKKNAVRVMKEDWDYLILLDACRYDMFKRIVDKKCPSRISGGSCTQEWATFNFNGHFDDVVYVAGNPHLSRLNLEKTFGHNPFYKVIELWDFGWDESVKTVPPSSVTKTGIETVTRYPNKRIIFHFNQPHHPFLMDKELVKTYEGTWNQLEGAMWERKKKIHVWEAMRTGKVSKERVWKGYNANLRLVMKDVEELIENLSGRIVITADHGNMVGEYFTYGHRSGLRTEQLVRIPWKVIDKGERPDFRSITPKSSSTLKGKISKLKKAGRV